MRTCAGAARLVGSLAATIAALATTGCPSGGRGEQIVVTGSSTVAPLMADIARRFEAAHPGVRIDVQTGGSSRGLADARRGLAHVGMVSRALRDDETDLQAFTVARDGICLIVHRDNPVAALSDEQVVGLYTRRLRAWREVGGGEGEVVVVNKADGRSTLELFLHHFRLRPDEVRPDVVIGDNMQGIHTVAVTPTAIGYVSIGSAEVEVERGTAIRLLPVAGVAPTTENVRSGRFPISRPLNLVTNAPPTGTVQALIDFATSSHVHDLVAQHAFVAPR